MKKKIFGLCLAVFAGFSLIGCGNQQHNHDFSNLIKKENATCTVSGMEAHYLCSCGKYFDVNRNETTLEKLVINALGHDYEDSWVADKDPSCLEKGSEHRDCTRCGKDGRETRDIDALGHNMVLVPYLAPTCTVKGHLEYYQCNRAKCSHYSTDAKGDIVIKDIAAWLGEGGEGYIAPTGVHTYVEDVKDANLKEPADCENAAVYYKSCSCGLKSTETFTYGDPLGHDYGTLVAKVNKTCTQDGFDAHYQCSRCATYFTTAKEKTTADALVIPAGHEIKAVEAVDPDFEKDGHIAGYECDLCHEHYSDSKGEVKVEDKDWFKSKLAFTEALDKVVYYDLTAEGLDACDTGLEGYSFMNADLTPVDVTGKVAGDEFTCFAAKQGETSYKISGLVATKVIKDGATFLSTLNPISSGITVISGYFVIGNDIKDLSSNVAWTGDAHGYKLSGTLDGRNHKLINPTSTSTGGIFGARGFDGFTIKDLTFENAKLGGYGLFSYWCDNLTLENVKFTVNSNGTYSQSIFACVMQNCKYINCEFDTSNQAQCCSVAVRVVKPTFTNTVIKRGVHNYAGLCRFTDYDGKVAYEGEYDEDVIWQYPAYLHLEPEEANYEVGGHGEGYFCNECQKYFTDVAHENEISKEDFYSTPKLPSTKVDGVQLFYNLKTKAIDKSEADAIDVSKLVDGRKNALVFDDAKEGESRNVYLPGEPTYQYELVVVTDVIATETDFATKLNASANDLSGYFVVTKNLGTVNTVAAGSHSTATSVELTLDGRGHSIDLFIVKSSAGGMFGSCGSGKNYNVVFRNLTIKKAVVSAYGMFGYYPANGGGQSLTIENCDITGGGNGGFRYGLISTLSNTRISIKNSIFDFSKNDFSGKTEVYSGSFLFQSGARGTYENVTLIIILAHDTYKNNYTEGSKEYKDVIKPDAAIANAAAAERDTNSLVSKITGLTFLTARA